MLSLAIREPAGPIAHCLWTRQPFHHLKLEASITKDGGGDMSDISYDILVPEDTIFNLRGDRSGFDDLGVLFYFVMAFVVLPLCALRVVDRIMSRK